jgi:hypothetical protein
MYILAFNGHLELLGLENSNLVKKTQCYQTRIYHFIDLLSFIHCE